MMDRTMRLRLAAAVALLGGMLMTGVALSQDTPPNLRRLSEAHATLTGTTTPVTLEAVDHIYTYQQAKSAALAVPADTPAQQQARAAALARADALLELLAQRPVTAQTISQVDMMLGIDTAARASNLVR